MRRVPSHPGRGFSQGQDRLPQVAGSLRKAASLMMGKKTHFTRENVVGLQNTAATHPDRSTVFLVLTVRVPE